MKGKIMAEETKKIAELCRADLGKQVRCEIEGGSILQGMLEAVTHRLQGNFASIVINRHTTSTTDPDAVITFL